MDWSSCARSRSFAKDAAGQPSAYDFDGTDACVSVKFEYLEKKEIRYSINTWGGARNSPTQELSRDVELLIFGLLALGTFGMITWLCVAVGRRVVVRLDAKRVRELGEAQERWETNRVFPREKKLTLVAGLFLLGSIGELMVFGCQYSDSIFCQYVPWSVIFNVFSSGVMVSSAGLALSGIVFPKSFRRGAICALAVLELSFVIHLADAFSFLGYGMSFVACVRGFAGRFYFCAVGVALIVVLMAFSVPIALCLRSARGVLTRCNLTCVRYFGNVLRLVGWFGLLGLLVYETLILIWLNFAL